jgi:hypothetical protein
MGTKAPSLVMSAFKPEDARHVGRKVNMQNIAQGALRRRSAIELAKLIALTDNPNILEVHKKIGFLTYVLWLATEHEGKYKTRFRSEAAMTITDKKLLRHDHVIQRRIIADKLLAAKTEADIEAIMEDVVGCTVTKAEHELLGQFDSLLGWERYRAANISVLDTTTGSKLVLDNIGDPQPAPKFNIVSKTDDLSHSVARAARGEKTMGTEIEEMQLDYWTAFHKALDGRVPGDGTPRPEIAMGYPTGRADCTLYAVMDRRQKRVRAELYLEGANAKAIFHLLLKQKAEIERDLGFALDWQKLPLRKASRIARSYDADPENKADWARQHEWLAEQLIEMHRVLAPRVRALPRFVAA